MVSILNEPTYAITSTYNTRPKSNGIHIILVTFQQLSYYHFLRTICNYNGYRKK